MDAGKRAFGWFLALMLAIPGSLASSQVFTVLDVPVMAEMIGGGANPSDPELAPYWQLVHNQQEIFADCFNQPWTRHDTYLALSGWAHADFARTSGMTSSSEVFWLDIVLAATADLEHDTSIDEETRGQLAAMQFEWSWVAAYLSGPRAVVPIHGILISMAEEGEQFHFLLIAERLDENAMSELEEQQAYHYGRTLASTLCVDENGDPVPTDSLYDTCMQSVKDGYERERSCLITQSGVGGFVASTLFVGCWTVNVLGGGIATPACWLVTGGVFAYGSCMSAQWPLLWSEKNYAEDCCCNTQKCRNAGQPGCPSISTCDMPHIYCNQVSCAPLF
ncbi:MAG: hypothetical protein D6695_12305 [Planctomycetota bacterium]|nr:MAG: hypothetical protein D6695_12305 [Planctomycetota bacterium]